MDASCSIQAREEGLEESIGRIQEKKQIFKEIKKELGLIVTVAKCGGSGTTNDGNTSRVAFQNHEKFAAMLGINPVLVEPLRHTVYPLKPGSSGSGAVLGVLQGDCIIVCFHVFLVFRARLLPQDSCPRASGSEGCQEASSSPGNTSPGSSAEPSPTRM